MEVLRPSHLGFALVLTVGALASSAPLSQCARDVALLGGTAPSVLLKEALARRKTSSRHVEAAMLADAWTDEGTSYGEIRSRLVLAQSEADAAAPRSAARRSRRREAATLTAELLALLGLNDLPAGFAIQVTFAQGVLTQVEMRVPPPGDPVLGEASRSRGLRQLSEGVGDLLLLEGLPSHGALYGVAATIGPGLDCRFRELDPVFGVTGSAVMPGVLPTGGLSSRWAPTPRVAAAYVAAALAHGDVPALVRLERSLANSAVDMQEDELDLDGFELTLGRALDELMGSHRLAPHPSAAAHLLRGQSPRLEALATHAPRWRAWLQTVRQGGDEADAHGWHLLSEGTPTASFLASLPTRLREASERGDKAPFERLLAAPLSSATAAVIAGEYRRLWKNRDPAIALLAKRFDALRDAERAEWWEVARRIFPVRGSRVTAALRRLWSGEPLNGGDAALIESFLIHDRPRTFFGVGGNPVQAHLLLRFVEAFPQIVSNIERAMQSNEDGGGYAAMLGVVVAATGHRYRVTALGALVRCAERGVEPAKDELRVRRYAAQLPPGLGGNMAARIDDVLRRRD